MTALFAFWIVFNFGNALVLTFFRTPWLNETKESR